MILEFVFLTGTHTYIFKKIYWSLPPGKYSTLTLCIYTRKLNVLNVAHIHKKSSHKLIHIFIFSSLFFVGRFIIFVGFAYMRVKYQAKKHLSTATKQVPTSTATYSCLFNWTGNSF